MKEYAPACDRNSQVILDVLTPILARSQHVLEIGSGTGQHAVYFAAYLRHLQWQPSNKESLASINAWREGSQLKNLSPAISLDLLCPLAEQLSGLTEVDAIVCINAIHIMAWQGTEKLFELAADILPAEGIIYLYGPYRYTNKPLVASNEDFDQWLKGRDSASGIRGFDAVDRLAQQAGFECEGDVAMPANNRSIWWIKRSE